jgi:hypothetical protein
LTLSLPRLRLPKTVGPWLPLSVACALWLLFLLFGSGRFVPSTAGTTAGLLVPWQVALALAIAGFCAGAALPRTSTARLIAAALGLISTWAAILVVYQLRVRLPGTIDVLAQGLGGMVLGLAVGLLLRSSLQRRESIFGNSRVLGGLALVCAMTVSLAPFAAGSPLTAPFAPITTFDLVRRLPDQVYGLIKGAMIWVPLGFVLAVGGLDRGARRWVPSGVVAFFLVGWPFFPALRVIDLLEVLFAPVGIWIGVWLGERMRTDVPMPAAEQTPGAPPDVAPAPTPAAASEAATRPRLTAIALPRPNPPALLASLALVALAAWGWWWFPRFQVALGAALLLYLLLLIAFRHAWLVAIPALLPVLDLAPWTGRFYVDESDLFLLVTLGAAFLHRRDSQAGPFLARPVAALAALFAATTLIALLLGLYPLAPLDANAFATYFSHYNALRVAKGFAWGLGFLLLLRWSVRRGSELPARLFTAGMLLGLLGVVLIGVRERWQYGDLLDFSTAYRITASFSSMHTGDSHLPAFLALAVPFVWLWVVRLRPLAALPVGLVLFSGAVYLVVLTVTRAAVLALALQLALLALFWLRSLRLPGARVAAGALAYAAMVAVAGGVLYLGIQGAFFQKRLATVSADADTRIDHWRTALGMMDQGLPAQVFGMGLGRFPETYLWRNPQAARPGNFRYAQEDGNGYLLLGAGETLYLAQRVPAQPHTRYRLAFDLRGDGERLSLTVPLCEKHLLNSRRCNWNTYDVRGGKGWQRIEATLDSGRVGEGNWLDRPPVELFLYNGGRDQRLAVDNVSLRAPDGRELLRNGDFSAGGDFWFFKTHDHLAWHIKNVWVSLLFEQGWFGLIAFNLLMLAALLHLARPAWSGDPVPAAALTAIVGFLAVGFFASPFDAPRLTALFFAVLAVGLHATPAAAGEERRPWRPWRRIAQQRSDITERAR